MRKFHPPRVKVSSSQQTKLALSHAFNLLDEEDLIRLRRWTLVQIIVNFLDLAAIFLTACVVDINLNSTDTSAYASSTKFLLKSLRISDTSLTQQLYLTVGILLVFLISKTLCSVFITRRIIFFLTKKASRISIKLIEQIFSSWKSSKIVRSTDELIYSITRGIDYLLLEVIANILVLVSDISLLVIMVLGLIYIDPKLATISIILFSIVGSLIYKSLNHRSIRLGRESAELNVSVNELVAEVFHSFREYFVRNRIWFNIEQIGYRRNRFSTVMAELTFMPFISKYVFELTLVFGSVVIGIFQITTNDPTRAIISSAVFLVAGTRITPALLRIQQNVLQIKSRIGMAKPTLDLIKKLKDSESTDTTFSAKKSPTPKVNSQDSFSATLEIRDLYFSYAGSQDFSVKNLSLNLGPNNVLGIFGKSGSGKTTTVDLMLGLLTPDKGSVLISGVTPRSAIEFWAGRIGYVPQDISLFNGSIKENLLRGYSENDFTQQELESALTKAGLLNFVLTLPDGIDSEIGERGKNLSGGQRQRLGVARVLLTDPKFIILDEATSALDEETENEIIRNLKGGLEQSILVIITHRIEMLRECDMIVELEGGDPTFVGTYDEFVKRQVANIQ